MAPKLTDERIAQFKFDAAYRPYLNKVLKKGRTEDKLLQVIKWLTGFTKAQVKKHVAKQSTVEKFFDAAKLTPNASLITGMICGYRVEEIEHTLTQNARYLDELARGKKMENVLLS